MVEKIADRRYLSPIKDADWDISATVLVQAQLSLSLGRHVPKWRGATDKQLKAVAEEILELLDGAPFKTSAAEPAAGSGAGCPSPSPTGDA